MIEIFRGQGSYLLCQLPLASRFAVEPMARELLARIVAYSCSDAQYACPVKTLSAITDPASETAAILDKLKVKHRLTATDATLDANAPVLLDADTARSAKPEQRARWANMLSSGARLLIVNAQTAGLRVDQPNGRGESHRGDSSLQTLGRTRFPPRLVEIHRGLEPSRSLLETLFRR